MVFMVDYGMANSFLPSTLTRKQYALRLLLLIAAAVFLALISLVSGHLPIRVGKARDAHGR
jgi:hypothetical protein